MDRGDLCVIEEDLSALLKEALQQGITGADLRSFLLPITSLLPSRQKAKGQRGWTRKVKLKRVLKGLVPLVCLMGILYGVLSGESSVSLRSSIRFHGLAFIRIALVKVQFYEYLCKKNSINQSMCKFLLILDAADLELDGSLLQSVPHSEPIL